MFGWFKKRAPSNVAPAGQDEDWEGVSSPRAPEGPTKRVPAWALLFRSPFEASGDATSWLGGVPHAPAGFVWPGDTDGSPLSFLAQFDLASLKAQPETGMRPPCLPAAGALLVFVGRHYACRILSEREIRESRPLGLPDDLGPLRKHGFFSDERTFARWPVTPVPYLDQGEGRPDFLPDTFRNAEDWILNWGLAALDAETVAESLELELRLGADFEQWRSKQGDNVPANKVIQSKIAHYDLMRKKAPGLVAAVKAWRETALSRPAEGAVDAAGLREIMRQRLVLRDEMQDYSPKFVLPGNAEKVWDKMCRAHPELRRNSGYDALPLAWRPFVEARITGWRGHRLFGIEPEFPNNGENLAGYHCLVSIAADPMLGTQSEHEYGMSIWYPDGAVSQGLDDRGKFVRHCAV